MAWVLFQYNWYILEGREHFERYVRRIMWWHRKKMAISKPKTEAFNKFFPHVSQKKSILLLPWFQVFRFQNYEKINFWGWNYPVCSIFLSHPQQTNTLGFYKINSLSIDSETPQFFQREGLKLEVEQSTSFWGRKPFTFWCLKWTIVGKFCKQARLGNLPSDY